MATMSWRLTASTTFRFRLRTTVVSGTQVGIQQGQITVTQDSNTPTGNVAKGQSQITLAKFDFYAAGEAVRVKYLDFYLSFGGLATTTANLSKQVQNVSLTDDAGGQVGSTINQPPSSNSCSPATSPSTIGTQMTASATGTVYADCFGTSASPINYVIPANTTRVLSLKADIQSTASFSTVTAGLLGDASNLQGLTSSQVTSSGVANGSALSLASSNLVVAANNALGSQNVSAGVTSQEIGSYSLTASSAEGVSVSNVSVQANGAAFQNMKLLVNGVQFGTTQGTVSSGTHTPSPARRLRFLLVARWTSMSMRTLCLRVRARSLRQRSLTGLSGTGLISNAAISLVSSVPGQALSFGGSPSIQVSYDSTQPPAGIVVMGATGNTLGVFRFTETSNIENVKVTDLHVIDAVSSTATVKAAFSNLTLWNGSTAVGTAGSAIPDASGTGYVYSFHFATPIIVPQANSVSLTLKGDASSYSSAGATDLSQHTFEIVTTSDTGSNSSAPANTTSTQAVVALGATSNKPAAVSIVNAAGNTETVQRSAVTVSASAGGLSQKGSPEIIGGVTFSANNAGPVALQHVTITFSGSALTAGSSTFSGSTSTGVVAGAAGGNIQLIDANGNNVISANEATASTTLSAGTVTAITWTFTNSATTGGGFQVSAGGSYTFTLKANTNLIPGTANTAESFSANIQNPGDVSYWDALDASSTLIASIPTSTVPLNINSVSYGVGQ